MKPIHLAALLSDYHKTEAGRTFLWETAWIAPMPVVVWLRDLLSNAIALRVPDAEPNEKVTPKKDRRP